MRHPTLTQQQMSDLLKRIQEEENAVREAGQKEYAHDPDNAFRNFQAIASEVEVTCPECQAQVPLTQEVVLWVYFKKHLDGILAAIKGHRSQRESVEGRIKDARMYLALLWGMFDAGRERTVENVSWAVEDGTQVQATGDADAWSVRYVDPQTGEPLGRGMGGMPVK